MSLKANFNAGQQWSSHLKVSRYELMFPESYPTKNPPGLHDWCNELWCYLNFKNKRSTNRVSLCNNLGWPETSCNFFIGLFLQASVSWCICYILSRYLLVNSRSLDIVCSVFLLYKMSNHLSQLQKVTLLWGLLTYNLCETCPLQDESLSTTRQTTK